VSARIQRCAQTQEWITDRGMSNCASRKSPPSVRTLAWLGLAGPASFVPWFKHSTLTTSRDTYQEGRNNAGLPGHDASWTGHYTTGEGPVTSTDPDYRATLNSLYTRSAQ